MTDKTHEAEAIRELPGLTVANWIRGDVARLFEHDLVILPERSGNWRAPLSNPTCQGKPWTPGRWAGESEREGLESAAKGFDGFMDLGP